MKKTAKVLICLLCFIVAVSGCSKNQISEDTVNDKRVEEAVEVIKSHWRDYYDKQGYEDKYLKITNTRVINIKGNDIDKANINNIDYIVEFDLYSNYFNTSPYYENSEIDDVVIVYKDGTKEIGKNPVLLYRTLTYKTNCAEFIESIEEYDDQYSKIVELD